MPGLDDALAALKDLGSAFLLGFFFPIVLFTTINFGLVILLLGPGPAVTLATTLRLDTAVGVMVALFAQFALAWIAAPMVTVLRRTIEGEMLPEWLKRPMLRQSWRAAQARLADVREISAWRDSVADLKKGAELELIAARATGAAKKAITDHGAIGALQTAVEFVAFEIPHVPTRAGRATLLTRLRAMVDAATEALKANATGLAAGPEVGVAASDRLDRLHQRVHDLLVAAFEDAVRAAEEAEARSTSLAVRDDIRPSQLGNLRSVMERYTTQAYGVSFDYLWPRIQSVIGDNAAVAGDLSRSKMQIEFGLMMIAGTALTCAVWLIVSFLHGAPWLFLGVGAVGPIMIGLFYRMALAGQRSLTEAVRAAIDTRRSALLGELGVSQSVIDATTTGSAECTLWQALQSWSFGADSQVKIR